MAKKKDFTVYIGRFSPFHNGHADVLKRALDTSKVVLVLIGSPFQPRTIKNPFTYEERRDMIFDWADDYRPGFNLYIAPINDEPYNDQIWIQNVHIAVNSAIDQARPQLDLGIMDYPDKVDIYLTGADRDETSWYLKCFPTWKKDLYPKENVKELSATSVREILFSGYRNNDFKYVVPESTRKFLYSFTDSREHIRLKEEFEYISQYKESWNAAPYPPTFVTVDAVVVQSGHVILIKRRAAPGKGLRALPGGFVNQNETLEDACIRELREETKLKIPIPVLKGCIKSKEIFDKPDRSLRGRTITVAFLIVLPDAEDLPKIKGGDDATIAKWIPINDALNSTEKLFEDHHAIITTMISRAIN